MDTHQAQTCNYLLKSKPGVGLCLTCFSPEAESQLGVLSSSVLTQVGGPQHCLPATISMTSSSYPRSSECCCFSIQPDSRLNLLILPSVKQRSSSTLVPTHWIWETHCTAAHPAAAATALRRSCIVQRIWCLSVVGDCGLGSCEVSVYVPVLWGLQVIYVRVVVLYICGYLWHLFLVLPFQLSQVKAIYQKYRQTIVSLIYGFSVAGLTVVKRQKLGPQCTKVPQTHLKVLSHVGQIQRHSWILHTQQFPKEDSTPLHCHSVML